MDLRNACERWLVQALTDLGPVLCLHRDADPHALLGLRQAKLIRVQVRIDSDGICESLSFLDADENPCWRLCLLPDSNYWAWDRILAQLQCASESDVNATYRPGNAFWRCCPLRLHACATVSGPTLAAAPVQLSATGARQAERLARIASGGRLAA